MKYVPVLRYRQEERKSLRSVSLTSKTVPLIEIVTQTVKGKTVFQQFHEDFPFIAPTVFVDFPTYIPMKNGTKQEVATFLRPLVSNHLLRVPHFMSLKGLNIIPVVTYNPQLSSYVKTIVNEASQLRPVFSKLAFRIFINHATYALAEIQTIIKQGDVIILDIGETPHTSPALQKLYNDINALKDRGVETVLIRSAILVSVTNTSLISGQIIAVADNSLLTSYSSYGFNAFGDYAGLKRDDLTKGGKISPGFIYYSWHSNCYYGFNSPIKSLIEFENTITPSVLNSIPWGLYSNQHHTNCTGCKEIIDIKNKISSGKSQGKWKGMACSHYLSTMEEFL